MEAVFITGTVAVIAIVGYIYFTIQDKKEQASKS